MGTIGKKWNREGLRVSEWGVDEAWIEKPIKKYCQGSERMLQSVKAYLV